MVLFINFYFMLYNYHFFLIFININNTEKWTEESGRRAFFESYAIKKGFDYLNPEHWYSQTKSNVLSEKVNKNKIYY